MHLIWGLEKPPYRALHPDDKWNLEKNSDASLRLPDSQGAPTSCSPLKEQVICSSPALYIKCVIRLRAVGWGIEGALSGPVVSRPAVDITEKTDSELRDVAERARWAVQGCWKWVYQPPPPPPPPLGQMLRQVSGGRERMSATWRSINNEAAFNIQTQQWERSSQLILTISELWRIMKYMWCWCTSCELLLQRYWF